MKRSLSFRMSGSSISRLAPSFRTMESIHDLDCGRCAGSVQVQKIIVILSSFIDRNGHLMFLSQVDREERPDVDKVRFVLSSLPGDLNINCTCSPVKENNLFVFLFEI